MCNRIQFLILCLFVAIVAMPIRARCEDQPLTIEAAISEALDRNADVHIAEDSVGESSWKRLDALSPQLPQLTVNADHFLAVQYPRITTQPAGVSTTTPLAFSTTNLNLGATLLLFDGLGAIRSWRAANLNYEASRKDLSFARFKLEQGVRIAFYRAIAMVEFARVAGQNIKTLEEHLRLAKESEASGLGTRFDVLRIEAELKEAIAEKKLQDDNVVLARENLAQIMGLESDARPIKGSMPLPSSRGVPEDLKLDASSREDIQAEVRRAEAARKDLSAKRSAFLPKVSIFANRKFSRFGNFDPYVSATPDFDDSYSVGLGLSWNVFDGGALVAKERQAAYAAKKAEHKVQAAILDAGPKLDFWKRRYLYNVELYQARLGTIRESEESVRLAVMGLSAGTRTHTEMLDAELQLFRARAGAVEAQLGAAEAMANLTLYNGKALE